MPSVMTLEGPRLAALPEPTNKRLVLFAIGGAALLGVAFLFVRHEQKRSRRALRGGKRKPKGKLTVFDHEIDLDSGNVERIKRSIDTTTPGDYGADPIGPNSDGVFMYRMVPSGDVVTFEERERRLKARKTGLHGPEMLKIIASEARTPEEYARRIEAWNSAERSPLPVTKLAKAYRKASPARVAQLIREAREMREEGRERLWTRMSKGLRGQRYAEALEAEGKLARKVGAGHEKWFKLASTDENDLSPDDWFWLERAAKTAARNARRAGDEAATAKWAALQAEAANKSKGLGGRGGLRGDPGLDGYRIVYGSNDGKKTFGVLDENTFETIEGAIKRRRLYKNRGMTAWIEDEQGNFVPVPGAKSPTVRKSFPR